MDKIKSVVKMFKNKSCWRKVFIFSKGGVKHLKVSKFIICAPTVSPPKLNLKFIYFHFKNQIKNANI